MVLDITIGAIFAAVIPGTLRSRMTGGFQAVNYGTRSVGALLGGLVATAIGLRPALRVAAPRRNRGVLPAAADAGAEVPAPTSAS